MKGLEVLKRKFGLGPQPTAAISYTDSAYSFSQYGEPAEVKISTLMAWLKTDVQFRLAVLIHTAKTAGAGFYNTADDSKPAGRDALEIVNDFCEDWNLDEINVTTAMEGWATGNSFDNFVSDSKMPFAGIYKIPVSSITGIDRKESGQITHYIQYTGNRYSQVKDPQAYRWLLPEQVGHFKFLNIDQNAFGEGLGQIMARQGMGYQDKRGNTIKRPSHFHINEFMASMAVKILHNGVPRYVFAPAKEKIMTEQARKKVETVLGNLDVGQDIVVPFPADLKSVSLDTQNRFDSLFKNIEENRIAGHMTPIEKQWALGDGFSYASSKEATAGALPLAELFQRIHKRYIEQNIYAPLIIQSGKNPKKAGVRLNWGEIEKKELSEIKDAFEIIMNPRFVDHFNPEDWVDMMVDAGFKITKPDKKQMTRNVQSTMNVLNSVIEHIPENKEKIRLNEIEALNQKLEEQKLEILRNLT